MRIIIVNSREWPSKGPNSVFSISNAHGLARCGFDVVYIAVSGSKNVPKYDLQNFYGLQALENLRIILFPNIHIGPLRTRQFFYYLAAQKIIQLHTASPYDLIYSRDTGFLKSMAKLKNQLNIITFYESHNFFMDLHLYPIPKDQIEFMRKYYRMETKYLHNIDAICSLLSPQAELYRQYLGFDKVHVLHPGITAVSRPKDSLKRRNTIGYVGGLQQRRGLDILIDTLARVSDKSSKLLVIGGRGTERERFEKMVSAKGLNDRVLVTGWIDYKKLGTYLDRISVGLVPMKDTFYNRNLTAPLKIFDYFSRGIPVIAADLFSTREFVSEGKDGVFFKHDDSADLAEKIHYVFRENRLEMMSRHALETARSFTWEKRANKITDIVETFRGHKKNQLDSHIHNHIENYY